MLVAMLIKELEPSVKLPMLGLAVFLGIGGTFLSYNEGEGLYAYVPLSFAITSLLYSIYVAYPLLVDQDWGRDNKNNFGEE